MIFSSYLDQTSFLHFGYQLTEYFGLEIERGADTLRISTVAFDHEKHVDELGIQI